MLPEPACLPNHYPRCQNQPRPDFFAFAKVRKIKRLTSVLLFFFSFFTQKVLVVSKKVVSLQSDLRGEVKREEDRMVR